MKKTYLYQILILSATLQFVLSSGVTNEDSEMDTEYLRDDRSDKSDDRGR